MKTAAWQTLGLIRLPMQSIKIGQLLSANNKKLLRKRLKQRLGLLEPFDLLCFDNLSNLTINGSFERAQHF